MSKENTQESNNKPQQPPPKPTKLENIYITESYSKNSSKNKETRKGN